MRLSVIVPVFNVAPWIERCLESIIHIGLLKNEFEIVVVDDGSTDDSSKVLNDFVNNHKYMVDAPSIVIFRQENKGLSAARNKGLSLAKGDYVWFVDSDDYVESEKIRDLIGLCEKSNLDVLCFSLQLDYGSNNKKECYLKDDSKGLILNGADFITSVEMPPAAWCALYKREFLLNNRLLFMEGIIHEDQEFTPRAYYLAQRIMFKQVIVYNYVQREGSIMKNGSKKERRAKDLLKVADSLYAFTCLNLKENSEAYNVMMNKIAFVFGQSLRNFSGSCAINDYTSKPYYPLPLNNRQKIKEKLKYSLINMSVRMYLLIYRSLNIQ